VRVGAVGICGSDLHTYRDGRIGDTKVAGPIIPGHEFGGIVEAVGDGALDGVFRPLKPGTLVAVDPSQPCGACDQCELGNPNLCRNLHFCGLYPDDGAMCQWMLVPAHTCFPVPRDMDSGVVALLETLSLAVYAADLAQVRVGERVAVLGAGPVGLCALQTIKLAGAAELYVTEKLPWRLALAGRLGATAIPCEPDPVRAVLDATDGEGVDVAIEAAWAGPTVEQAAEMLRPGGRLVLVGIPGDDRLELRHSLARRKGLTMIMARRMKHVYPRAIRLAKRGLVDLASLISHRFPLAQAAGALAMSAAYEPGVVKVIVDVHPYGPL
jgi:L-iditol 2-dehydrogenase